MINLGGEEAQWWIMTFSALSSDGSEALSGASFLFINFVLCVFP